MLFGAENMSTKKTTKRRLSCHNIMETSIIFTSFWQANFRASYPSLAVEACSQTQSWRLVEDIFVPSIALNTVLRGRHIYVTGAIALVPVALTS